MPFLDITAASQAVAKHRSTLHRYIKEGKLSATKDGTGRTVIEVSELLRVFGELKNDGAKDSIEAQPLPANFADLQQELNTARGHIAWLMQQLDAEKEHSMKLEAEREREREHSRELERLMLGAGSVAPGKAEKKPGFWARLFGK